MGLILFSNRVNYIKFLIPQLNLHLQQCFESVNANKAILSELTKSNLENELIIAGIELENFEIQQSALDLTEEEINLSLQKYIETTETLEQYLKKIKFYSQKLYHCLKKKELEKNFIGNENIVLQKRYQQLKILENQLEQNISELKKCLKGAEIHLTEIQKNIEENLSKLLPTFKFSR